MTMDELERLEATVRRGLRVFIEVGEALERIHQGRGFQLRGYPTFDAYCVAELHIGHKRGYQLMTAVSNARRIRTITGEMPANERVTRELAGVARDPERVRRVHARLREKGKTFRSASAPEVKLAVQETAPLLPMLDHAPIQATKWSRVVKPRTLIAAAKALVESTEYGFDITNRRGGKPFCLVPTDTIADLAEAVLKAQQDKDAGGHDESR